MERTELSSPTLLSRGEPSPVIVEAEAGASPFVIVCDHAGRRIPDRLKNLSLPAEELSRHIAWDIGVEEVAALLSRELDAVCIRQRYSRLVIDCNRPPGHPQSVISTSEETPIPGNIDAERPEIDARVAEIFLPYHKTISAILDRRASAGQSTILIALHSFTPVFMSVQRPWEAGVLYERNPRFALLVKKGLVDDGLNVGDNEPYRLSDETDFTINEHAGKRGLPYVEIEIRQDLISMPEPQRDWAGRLGRVLTNAYAAFTN